MANTLGALVVKLGLDAAEFTTGLTKSEYQAQKFASKLDAQFKSVARTIASLGAGAAIGLFVRDVIASASALDDLSDATGSSVESLSKLANQAKISGRDFGELQSVMLKLAAGMAGADDDSSKTGRALAALGVTARDPAEALQQISIALNKYEDGIGKAAIARDLFGKTGPAFLATLKDIAETQDVAATTSAKMAADAEALEKALRRLSVEGTTLKDVILQDLVPWLNTLLEQFREGIKLAGGFGNALATLGTINPFRDTASNLAAYTKELEKLKAAKGSPLAELEFGGPAGIDKAIAAAQTRIEFLKLQQRQEAMSGAAALGYTGDARDFQAGRKPKLDYTGTPDKALKAGRAEVDEFAKALQRVRELAIETGADFGEAFSGEKVSPALKALERLQASDTWDKFNATQREGLTNAYKQVAALEKETAAVKAQREEREKQIKAFQEQAEAESKMRANAQASLSAFVAQNDVFERQIGIIGKGEQAYALLNAELEYNKRVNDARINQSPELIAGFTEQYDRQKLLIAAYYEANEVLQKQIEYNRIFTDSFSDAITSVVTGTKSIGDAFKDMEKQIVAAISRIAAQNIAERIFGVGKGGGGGIGSIFASLFSGGDLGIGFPTAGFASGTDYAPGGMALVGERGPEIVNLPRGAQVIPAERARHASGSTNVFNINVLPGASRQSGMQAAAAAAREARIAAVRNG